MLEMLIPLSIFDGFMGFMSALMQPLYAAVSGIVVFFHWAFSHVLDPDAGLTWTLSIIFLTLLVRTLLIPLFVKQINSARNMQLLQPKLTALQKKYGDDRTRLGEETMKLYREEGVNPMASCLPLLLQMPIFLALFRVLDGVATGNVRGHFFKENPHLVTSLQNAELLGAGLADRTFPLTPFGPTQVLGIILVVGMVVTFYITQLQLMRKNMPPESQVGQAAQMQKMMLYVFPLIYAMSSVFIPIGVLIYWLTSNLWTMAQQGILIRNNPAPNTPAYIDWEERMRAKGKDLDEIVRQRAEKRRRKRGVAPSRTVSTASSETSSETTTTTSKVARQNVTRQTTRVNEDGRREVTRQQPRAQSRAVRRKKK